MKSSAEHLISSAQLDAFYYQRGYLLITLRELKLSIIKPMEAKQRIVCKEEKNIRIKNFIQQRINNLKDAPSKMTHDSYFRTLSQNYRIRSYSSN